MSVSWVFRPEDYRFRQKLLPHVDAALQSHDPTDAGIGARLELAYYEDGKWKKAEKLYIKVMNSRKMVLGAEHPSTLASITNLASTLRNQGRWKEAEELFVQVMDTRKRVLGAEHPSTLTSMANLASTSGNQGR